MRPTALLLAIAAIPCAVHAADTEANNYWVRASVSAWAPSLSGDFAYERSNSSETSISTDSVGLGDREVAPMLDVDVKVPLIPFLPNLHVGLYQFDTEGSETLSKNTTFGGSTFSAGTDVDSTATLTDLYIELNWQPIDWDIAGVGFGIGAHSLQAEVGLKGGGFDESFDGPALIPVLALLGHVNPLDSVGIEAAANGISMHVGDFDGTFLDLRLQAIWRPINWLGVVGGYRHILIDADIEDGKDDLTLDLSLSGPYLGALAQL